jgi:anti-sigma factor RsiW
MTCSSVDLKAYVLGELPESEKGAVAVHVRECASCGEEMERLSLTHRALTSLRDEEVPRRIAFVSDKVFEPRWWQRVWRSGPAMGFASAAVLACAILAHGLVQPAPLAAPAATVDSAEVERRVAAQLNDRVNAVVAKAVSDAEAKQQQKTAELLADVEKKFEFERKADQLAFASNLEVERKERARLYMASSGLEVR